MTGHDQPAAQGRSPESILRLALPWVPTRFAPVNIMHPEAPPDWISRDDVTEALDSLVAENERLLAQRDSCRRFHDD